MRSHKRCPVSDCPRAPGKQFPACTTHWHAVPVELRQAFVETQSRYLLAVKLGRPIADLKDAYGAARDAALAAIGVGERS
jgi:hypothetical protein